MVSWFIWFREQIKVEVFLFWFSLFYIHMCISEKSADLINDNPYSAIGNSLYNSYTVYVYISLSTA